MTWFAFPNGWGTYNLNGIAEKELAATGAHGYATQQQAEAHVNASPTMLQQALLQTDKAASISPVGAGVSGVQQTPSGTGGVSGLLGNLTSAALHWPGADTFLSRALKIVVGGILLLAGIIKLSGADRAAIPIAGQVVGKLPGV